MALTNAEKHYFDALVAEDIAMYQHRADEDLDAAARAEAPGSPYHQSLLTAASHNRGIVQGLKLAAELLEKAQT